MSHSRLLKFAASEAFEVTLKPDSIVLDDVPCLLANGKKGFCRIEKSYDRESKSPTSTIGGALHGVRVSVPNESDHRVYHADGSPIGNLIQSDDKSWSEISIKLGSAENPEDDKTASHVVYRYAKQIIGAAYNSPDFQTATGPFKIPNTFEDRSGLRAMQDQIRNQCIAIVGLGGTGSYILDLMIKTPVKEIHIFDDDVLNWHNFMRAPGSPTCDELNFQRKKQLKKVNYYLEKYKSLRNGIVPHSVRIDDEANFIELLKENSINFAFVCIDQHMASDLPRQDIVYSALSKSKVSFIDSGVSITLENDQVRGAVTTSIYESGSQNWKLGIPNARINENYLGYRNIQLPEVNALAASLAVMEWRRHTHQYVPESQSFLHKFRLESASVKWAN